MTRLRARLDRLERRRSEAERLGTEILGELERLTAAGVDLLTIPALRELVGIETRGGPGA